MNTQMKLQRDHYPGAERTRRAKLKFFSELKSFYKEKQKTYIESNTSEGNKDEPKVNLSIPGTPVCSRYLGSLSRRQSESNEKKQPPVQLPNEIVISSLVIDKFLQDMKSLNDEEQHAEVVNIEEFGTDNEDEQSKSDGDQQFQSDLAQQYFKESDEKHAYQRTFSEAVQTLHSAEVRSPVVKRYFDESQANHSYSRSFNEAFSQLDPQNLKSDPLLIDSEVITKGYKSSVPGTPISSTRLDQLRRHNYISDSSDDDDDDDPKNRSESILTDPLEKFIKDMEQLKADKENIKIEKKPLTNFAVDEYLASSEKQKSYARSFSQAAQTLYGSEVKSPVVKRYFEQSEQKKAFRRDFSEVYQELSEVEQPIKIDSTADKVVPDEQQNEITEIPVPRIDSLEELFGKHPEKKKLDNKPMNDFSVDSYMTSSDARKTYARTFSEAAQSLHTSDVKSPTVRNYFNQSEAKHSFRRGFSEAYQEVNLDEITNDIIPTHRAAKLASAEPPKQDDVILCSSAGDDDRLQPTDRNPSVKQTKRSISVPGTPINSRKLYPREKQPCPVESKPKYDPPSHAHRPPAVRARTASASENTDKEFWKRFGATAV
ncbi:uncharacterized protein LOC131429150 isoform X2 [Malaya genurostris]|uniref:uncharacterized protein LOC131429150 isoform X2 n=1 Tax=Malaya genurostris TaxID=325434 RepID=UPI0026F3ED77|nr:uncharacterized protein LOC131429150 isoform X2 [Malaya genurostris]